MGVGSRTQLHLSMCVACKHEPRMQLVVFMLQAWTTWVSSAKAAFLDETIEWPAC